MKKGTVIGIIFAVLALVGLGALSLYLALQYRESLLLSSRSTTESEADAVLASLSDSSSQTENATEPATDEYIPESEVGSEDPVFSHDSIFLIWAGDSRTLGMRDALQNDDLYIGASGEGYDWLSETGLPQLKAAIQQYPDAPVVFNFGVNDYDNMERYLALYESLPQEFPDTHFYYLSVNPIEPTLCQNITNEEIRDFNEHLKAAFPDTYIDSFTNLMINEATTIDGIHYSKEDYRAIYEFAVQQILKKEAAQTADR